MNDLRRLMLMHAISKEFWYLDEPAWQEMLAGILDHSEWYVIGYNQDTKYKVIMAVPFQIPFEEPQRYRSN